MNTRYIYRIYISSEGEGYELVKRTYNEAKIEEYREKCKLCDWLVKMLVVKHDIRLNADEPYYLEVFYPNGKSQELGAGKRL